MQLFKRQGVALFVFVLLLGLSNVSAQVDYSTATLKGTVLDPLNAVISGATVTATNVATGVVKTTKSGSDGIYQILALPPGTYNVTIEAQGFSKSIASGLELSVGQSLDFDAHMKVGGISQTLEVAATDIPLIQTDQTQQANTLDERQVENLPNIGRNFTNDVYTLPGVTNSDATRSQNPGFTGFLTTGFSIGGSNGRNNLSTIDGGENEYGTGQYRVTNIPVDAIQEFQVNRNGYNAEFGFSNGSAINIVTKSGSNQWHGNAFGYFRNHSTDATNFFDGLPASPTDPTRPAKPFSQAAYMGGTLGGAIVKNKLFFFASYERQRIDTPVFSFPLNAQEVQGPSAAQVAYVNALKASGNPFLVGFGDGVTPGLTPLNNPALNAILTRDNGVFNTPDRLHNAILRLDYQPTDKDSVNLRIGYAHNDFHSVLGGITTGGPDGYGLFVQDFSILGSWTRTINPSLVNQLLVQVVPHNSSNALPNSFTGVNFTLDDLGLPGPGGTGSFGSPSLVPYKAHQQRFQFEDNITLTHGAHTFKFGASERPANYHVENDLWFNNEFDFTSGIIPLFSLAPKPQTLQPPCGPLPPSVQLSPVQCPLALFNLGHGFPITGPTDTNLSAAQLFAFGLPVDVLGGFNNPKWQGWGNYFGSYIQDTWKVSPKLTLNAGVRFDVDGEPSPLSTSFYASPRLGFAWDPFGDHKTVIRASGGIFVAPVDVLIPSYGSLLDGSGRYINEVLGVLSATDPRVAQLWQTGIALGILPFGNLTPQQFQQFSTVTKNGQVLIPGFDPNAPGATVGYGVATDYKNPYSIQGSLSIDRQLARDLSLELGYNVYHGVHLQMPLETAYQQISPGNPLCPTAACTDLTGGPLYAPTTGQFQHTTYTSEGSSIYHGLTTSLTKRFSHGLQFQANYTWSKTIDDVIDFASFQNWFRPSLLNTYRAVSVFNIPQSFVANAVYTTPGARGGKVAALIFGDISISPFVTVRSGLPFSERTPSVVNKINGQVLDNNYAIPFNASRDQNRGPVFASADLRVTKSIFINRDHGVRMDLIVEGTNIFNRVNFNRIADQFDINGIGSNGVVQTAQGPLSLLTGPFTGLHGVVPHTQADLTTPLTFASADAARTLQFGLRLAF